MHRLTIYLLPLLAAVGTMNCATTKTPASPSVFTPEAILPAGEDFTLATNPYTGESGRARKGIIAATLNNIVLLNKLLAAPDSDDNSISAIVDAVNGLIPSLHVVGIFDLFKVEEWLNTNDQMGRIMVAALYLQAYPQKLTNSVRTILLTIMDGAVHPHMRQEIERALAK